MANLLRQAGFRLSIWDANPFGPGGVERAVDTSPMATGRHFLGGGRAGRIDSAVCRFRLSAFVMFDMVDLRREPFVEPQMEAPESLRVRPSGFHHPDCL